MGIKAQCSAKHNVLYAGTILNIVMQKFCTLVYKGSNGSMPQLCVLNFSIF